MAVVDAAMTSLAAQHGASVLQGEEPSSSSPSSLLVPRVPSSPLQLPVSTSLATDLDQFSRSIGLPRPAPIMPPPPFPFHMPQGLLPHGPQLYPFPGASMQPGGPPRLPNGQSFPLIPFPLTLSSPPRPSTMALPSQLPDPAPSIPGAIASNMTSSANGDRFHPYVLQEKSPLLQQDNRQVSPVAVGSNTATPDATPPSSRRASLGVPGGAKRGRPRTTTTSAAQATNIFLPTAPPRPDDVALSCVLSQQLNKLRERMGMPPAAIDLASPVPEPAPVSSSRRTPHQQPAPRGRRPRKEPKQQPPPPPARSSDDGHVFLHPTSAGLFPQNIDFTVNGMHPVVAFLATSNGLPEPMIESSPSWSRMLEYNQQLRAALAVARPPPAGGHVAPSRAAAAVNVSELVKQYAERRREKEARRAFMPPPPQPPPPQQLLQFVRLQQLQQQHAAFTQQRNAEEIKKRGQPLRQQQAASIPGADPPSSRPPSIQLLASPNSNDAVINLSPPLAPLHVQTSFLPFFNTQSIVPTLFSPTAFSTLSSTSTPSYQPPSNLHPISGLHPSPCGSPLLGIHQPQPQAQLQQPIRNALSYTDYIALVNASRAAEAHLPKT